MLPIADLRVLFDLAAFIETGTEHGYGVEAALSAGFQHVYSCEIITDTYLGAFEKFKTDKRVSLFLGASSETLSKMIKSTKNKNILYWLDAHLPNCHDPQKEYTIEEILPLLDELKIISEYDNGKGIILIDDLCLMNLFYRKEDFDLQKWTGGKGARDIALDAIKQMFKNHLWYQDDRCEKVLIGVPRANTEIEWNSFSKLVKQFGWRDYAN